MSIETRNFYPSLERKVTPTASGSNVVSYVSDLGKDSPVLTLIHGYPQSAFIWRHVVPNLIGKISLFVPELPGYGISSPAKGSSRLEIGGALLESLRAAFGASADTPRKVVLGGHDRGARICHRLAVSRAHFAPALEFLGAILLDIVPTKVQWDRFQDPEVSKGYFHWPLLANVEIAVAMLKAYGGGRWCRDGHLRMVSSEVGRKRKLSDGALDVYAALFDKEETLRCSCEDYAYGATPEYSEQAADQEAGRKIDVPTVVMFSEVGLGRRIKVADEWRDWIAPGVRYEPVPVGHGYGHYLPEEAHEIVSEHIIKFIHEIEDSEGTRD